MCPTPTKKSHRSFYKTMKKSQLKIPQKHATPTQKPNSKYTQELFLEKLIQASDFDVVENLGSIPRTGRRPLHFLPSLLPRAVSSAASATVVDPAKNLGPTKRRVANSRRRCRNGISRHLDGGGLEVSRGSKELEAPFFFPGFCFLDVFFVHRLKSRTIMQ